jgi:hypothetical protein
MGQADDDDRTGDLPGQRLEGAPVGLDELGLEEEVLGRVARQGLFGEGDELGAQLLGPADRVLDAAQVAVEIADRGVHLGEGDAKRAHDAAILARA